MSAPDLDSKNSTRAEVRRDGGPPDTTYERHHCDVDPNHDPAYLAISAAFERHFREEESAAAWREWITTDPNVMVGKPTFKGTRLTVELVLESLGAGATEKEMLDSYPRLRPEHIRATFAFAADVMRRRTPDVFVDAK